MHTAIAAKFLVHVRAGIELLPPCSPPKCNRILPLTRGLGVGLNVQHSIGVLMIANRISIEIARYLASMAVIEAKLTHIVICGLRSKICKVIDSFSCLSSADPILKEIHRAARQSYGIRICGRIHHK